MSAFTFKGETYEYVNKPTLGEMAFLERKVGANLDEMTRMEAVISGYYVAVKRGRLASGGKVTWEEISEADIDQFQDIPEPEPEQSEYVLELDPKEQGTQTEPPATSEPPVSLDVSQPNVINTSLSSQSIFDSPPPR